MIGTDICNPKRIEQVYKKFGAKFLKRIFTDKEIEEINSLSRNRTNLIHRIAGRFAAKEAISKALGTGIGKDLSFKDFEIIKCPKGKPQVILNNKATKLTQELGFTKVHISISHEESLAIAFAIMA